MAAKHQTKKSIGKKRAIAIAGTLVLVAAALLVFLYSDSISALLSSETADESYAAAEPFTFETGSRQYFSLVGDRLVVASSTGLQILNSKGETLQRSVFSMTNPAISVSEDACAFYDVGGKALRVYSGGDCAELDRDYPIISVQMNSSDYIAAAEQESGYKGLVTVFDPDGSPIYEWYSGSGYVVDAAVSPDSSSLAVLCVESTGSVVHFFKLDSEVESFSVPVSGELAFRLSFFKNGTFCTLSEDALHFFSGSGKERSVYSFDGSYLVGFKLTSELCAVSLSKYVSGSDIILYSFSSDGDLYGSVPLSGEPVSLFAQKQKLLVLCSDRVSVFSRDMRTLKEERVIAGYKDAVITPKGSVFLLTSNYAEELKS